MNARVCQISEIVTKIYIYTLTYKKLVFHYHADLSIILISHLTKKSIITQESSIHQVNTFIILALYIFIYIYRYLFHIYSFFHHFSVEEIEIGFAPINNHLNSLRLSQ